ncbi:APC family permease [Luteimonas sp. RIT-PG2_3]
MQTNRERPSGAMPPAGDEGGLRRVLGPVDIALLTVGSVIGSGIFLVPGQVLAGAGGHAGWATVLWLAGGVLALCGALSYASLAESRPQAGGLYLFIRDGFGRTAGFLFGWMMVFVGVAGTTAALAAAFASLVSPWLPGVPQPLLAGLAAAAIGAGALLPSRGARDLQNGTALLKLLPLLAIAIWLLVTAPEAGVASSAHATPQSAGPGIAVALISVLWAFEGWQYVTYACGEFSNPRRSIRIGLIGGVAILGVTFVLVTLAVGRWLPEATSGNVVAQALVAAGHMGTARFVDVVVVIAVLSAAHATLLTGSRLVYAIAGDGLLPAPLARLTSRHRVPAAAVLLCAAVSIVLAMVGSFDALLGYIVVTSWLFYALAALAVFRLLPSAGIGTRLAAIVFATGALAMVAVSLLTGPPSARYGLVVLAVGGLFGHLWLRSRASQG